MRFDFKVPSYLGVTAHVGVILSLSSFAKLPTHERRDLKYFICLMVFPFLFDLILYTYMILPKY